MPKFTICIEEMISQEFEVEAEDWGEALEFGQEKYKNGEFVLVPGNLVTKQIAIMHPEPTEWIEF